ncbi:hypothetical protein [Comamonas composti]|nr:hypothetical protein [Comamonas composti]
MLPAVLVFGFMRRGRRQGQIRWWRWQESDGAQHDGMFGATLDLLA